MHQSCSHPADECGIQEHDLIVLFLVILSAERRAAPARQRWIEQGRGPERPRPRGVLQPAGGVRDRSFENQQHRASGLNLVVAAIVLWNTVYLEKAVRSLAAARTAGRRNPAATQVQAVYARFPGLAYFKFRILR